MRYTSTPQGKKIDRGGILGIDCPIFKFNVVWYITLLGTKEMVESLIVYTAHLENTA